MMGATTVAETAYTIPPNLLAQLSIHGNKSLKIPKRGNLKL
jgi:hypothetical protein